MGQVLTLLLGSAAPTFALLAYAVSKSRDEWRNPVLWTAVVSGGMAALVARLIEPLVFRAAPPGFLAVPGTGRAAAAAMVIAAVEEAVKFLALVLIAGRGADARRLPNVIALAV